MVALYTVWYNVVRINSAVRMARAMTAGISDRLWGTSDIVKLIEAAAPKPGQRGPYKKQNSPWGSVKHFIRPRYEGALEH